MSDIYVLVDREYDAHQYAMDYLNSTKFNHDTQQEWNEERMNIIGQNGNEGSHYQESVEYYPPGGCSHKAKTQQRQDYYDVGGIEVIDYIKAKLTDEQYKGYLLGNIYKYSGRMQYKGDENRDTIKLAQYTNWLLKHNADHA